MINKEPFSVDSSYYDFQYFENGVQSGKSLYENYQWLPELTIPLARIVLGHIQFNDKFFNMEKDVVLDFGCAKGFLVKALRQIGVNSFGVDISNYAVSKAPKDIAEFLSVIDSSLSLPRDWPNFKWIIAKDVLEHFPYSEIDEVLRKLSNVSKKILAVIPMGNGEEYYISEYEDDKSHFIREDLDWWIAKFQSAGFNIEGSYEVGQLKSNWVGKHPRGNGLFVSIK